MLIPAAGFLQAAGVNTITLTAATTLAIAGLVIAVEALRSVMTVTRDGLIIRRRMGGGDVVLVWADIEKVKVESALLVVTTKSRSVYQLELTERAAALVGRSFQRSLHAS